MTKRTALLSDVMALAAAAGCYTGSPVDANRGPDAPAVDTDGTEAADESADGGSSARPVLAPTGLPCDVAELLTESCAECHGERLSGGAPNRLLTYEDLTAPSEADPEMTVGEVSLARMKSTKRPMPPTGKLGSDRVAIFESWVESGMPKGTCGEDPGEQKVSSPKDAGGNDAAPDAASVCTS